MRRGRAGSGRSCGRRRGSKGSSPGGCGRPGRRPANSSGSSRRIMSRLVSATFSYTVAQVS